MRPPYDLIIIGAGWFGLSSAHAYLSLHPTSTLLILESSSTLGGTWSKNRLYPGLKSNNIVGSYEHPDFPMSGYVKKGEHIPGEVMHEYLCDFARRFGLMERIRFEMKVEVVELGEDGEGWRVIVRKEGDGDRKGEVIETKKLIVASGLTSTPNIPSYPGQESFTAPFFHAKEFCVNGDVINTAKRAVVIGGAKSAFDVAYAFATQENVDVVEMVIRKNGSGPVWLCPTHVTPLKRLTEELLHTRLLTWFSSCPWGFEDGFGKIRRWLHGTRVGRWIVGKFWEIMSQDVVDLNGYDKKGNELVKLLKPWNSVLWMGSGVSIHNYETSFWDLVREGKVRIHITDVERLEGKMVVLESGEVIETDVVVCATGWKKDTTFKFRGLGEAGLGLPHSEKEKLELNRKADEDVLNMFPSLRNQPVLKSKASSNDPLRLYRFVVPPTMVAKRNLAFAGMVSTVSTSIFAAVQGLWITAYFDRNLDRIASSQQEITDEVMLHTQWGKWRYPCGYGARLPDFAFDALCYIDLMLKDLGLTNHRKKSKMEEIFKAYKPVDYAGLVEEWKAAHNGYQEKANGGD